MFGRSGAVAAAVVVVVAGSGAASAVPVRAAHSGASHLTAGRKVATVSKVAPVISSLSPSKTRVGKHVEVLGRHLNEATEVLVHGRRARFHIVSSRRLTVLVPKRSTSGRVTVKASGESVSSPKPLAITQSVSPDAASSAFTFSPTRGAPGTTVTITATGSTTFFQQCYISFGGSAQTRCTVTSSTTITAVVPPTAFTGVISMFVGNPLSGTTPNYVSTATFRVPLGVTLSTSTGTPGSSTTVTGTGFGADEAVDVYVGETAEELVTADDNGNLSTPVTIPATAQPGNLEITAVGRRTEDSTGAAFTVNTDWAQDGFGAGNSNDNPFEDTLNTGNVSELGPDLSRSTSNGTDGSDDKVAGLTPVEVGGDYLIGDGSSPNTIDDITASGATVWTFSAGGQVDDVATYGGSAFLVTTNEVYAVSIATGGLIWQQSLTTMSDAGELSHVRVYAAHVLVDFHNNGVDQLDAFNPVTGAQNWTLSNVDNVWAAGDGAVFVELGFTETAAIDPQSGSELYPITTCSVNGQSYANAVIYRDEKLYIGCNSAVMAADASSGATLWTATIPDGPVGIADMVSLAATGGLVYANGYDAENSTDLADTFALNATTGAIVWQTGYVMPSEGFTSLTVANGVLYQTLPQGIYKSFPGDIQALDGATGNQLWDVSAQNVTPVVVSNGIVAVEESSGSSGTFETFDLTGGRNAAQVRRSSARSWRPNYGVHAR